MNFFLFYPEVIISYTAKQKQLYNNFNKKLKKTILLLSNSSLTRWYSFGWLYLKTIGLCWFFPDSTRTKRKRRIFLVFNWRQQQLREKIINWLSYISRIKQDGSTLPSRFLFLSAYVYNQLWIAFNCMNKCDIRSCLTTKLSISFFDKAK